MSHYFFTQTGYPPYIGGAQAYLHGLCQEFAKDHHVQVASFWAAHRTDWLLGTTLRAPGDAPYRIDNIPVTPIQFGLRQKLQMLPWVMGYYAIQGTAIQRLAAHQLPHLERIAGDKTDLIHHGRTGREPLSFASYQLAKQRDIPFILTPFHHPRWKGWLYRHYHWLYRQADVLLALTSAESDILTTFGVPRERIVVTGMSGSQLSKQYDVTAFRQKYKLGNQRYVLFLGQKYLYKGYETLLKAASQIWETHPDIHFLFVGPRTDDSRKIFQTVTDSRIIELDAVSLEEKTAALAACELLCVPSSQESFGVVYVEAWMMGKPVIGADIPAVREVIDADQNGFIGPVQPAFLADRIVRLLDDSTLQHQMGLNGKEKAEKEYSWQAIARRTEEAYQLAFSNRLAKTPRQS